VATYALNGMNGHQFDSKHTFFINRFTDIEKFAELDEAYIEPQREEYHSKVCLGFLCPNFGTKRIHHRNICALGWRILWVVISM
jgi:hypothetical protein